MGLLGKDGDAESRPKFLPIDSNAAGSGGNGVVIIRYDESTW